MNHKFWQTVVIIILVFIAITLYWTRFQVIPANYAYAPAFYKIDRLTGDITLNVGKEFVRVERVSPSKLVEPGAPSAQKNVPPERPAPIPEPTPAPAPGK